MTRNLYRSVRTQMFAFGAVLAVSAFLFGCSQPTSAPNSVARISATLPTANGHAIVDIPTPSFNGNTVSAGTTSGHMVCLTWQSNSPDNTTFDYSTGLDPVAGNLNLTHGWEYWGCTQRSIVTVNNGGNPAYSGHYELTRLNPDNTTTNLGDITADAFCDDNLADGTYTYYLKAKSLEGSTPNQMTHHSATSAGYSVTVSSCVDDANGTVNATISSVAVGTGTWTNTSTPSNGNTLWSETALWTKTANGNGYNIAFNIGQYAWIHNSCTGYSYSFTGGYTGDLWVKLDGGPWVHPLQYVAITHPYYQVNGQHIGALSTGPHTLYFSSTNSNAGMLGSFAIMGN